MVAQELADVVLQLVIFCTLLGACGGVLLASLVRWVVECMHRYSEREYRIAAAKYRDHASVPSIRGGRA